MNNMKKVLAVAGIGLAALSFNASAFHFGLDSVAGYVKDKVVEKTVDSAKDKMSNVASSGREVRPSAEHCKSLMPSGYPTMPGGSNLVYLCHQGYVVGYNTQYKTPAWVAELLTRENLDTKNATRNDNFRPDPALLRANASASASLSDYSGSSHVGQGYDRGHMAPAEDFRKFPDQMDESFYLSNMVPQNSNNNRGVWAALEKNVRDWAQRYQVAEVVTGPIYYNGRSQGNLGNIAIPTHLYKVVYLPTKNEAMAFILPNAPVDKSALPQYAMSVSDAEKLTGMKFFPGVSDAVKAVKPADLKIFNR